MRRFISILILCLPVAGIADDSQLAGYERAAALQRSATDNWVLNQGVQPRWIDGDSFWYAKETVDGQTWMRVDADAASNMPAFDHEALAAALAEHTEKELTAGDLPLSGLVFGDGSVQFTALGRQWAYDLGNNVLSKTDVVPNPMNWRVSPDGKLAVFGQEGNLWLQVIETGESRALTTDGETFYAYGAVPDATGRPAVKPEAVWSPDSRYLLTAQTDDRKVEPYAVIDFAPADGSVRPKVIEYRTALPGDQHVTQYRMTIIDTETGKQTSIHYAPIAATRMNDTPLGGNRAWWSADSERVFFVDILRGEQQANVVSADRESGLAEVIFTETTDTYLELGSNVYTPTSLVPLPETDEFIWYSEATGWAHLYLHDATTGKRKRALTKGDWLVRDVIGVNQERRELLIAIGERRKDVNPYDREIARVNLNNGRMKILSSGDSDRFVMTKGDFSILLLEFQGEDISTISGSSPTGEYYVEARQRADRPNQTWLVDREGGDVLMLEEGDPVGVPEDFNWPERVLLTAADGETVINGLVFRPSDFDPAKSYPVIDSLYGGPQVAYVPKASFAFGLGFDTSASLAELGFIVVMIDGRGTTERSRAFHEGSRGALETASNLEDHIAGIKQLAERYPYMDLDRVGVTGFSGGGYMTAIAMLKFGDFYKVGVAGAGNFDQRLFWHSWGERYQGMLDGDNYVPQAAVTYADGLQGKLLFIHGLLDHGVHPGGLFQLTQALMDANKQFDLVLMPRAAHELPGYAMVRMWDYFVKHLAGEEPPVGFTAESSGDLSKAEMMAMMAEKAADAAAAAAEQ